MFFPEEWGIPDHLQFQLPRESNGVARRPWLERFERDARRLLQNQLETRRFLAEVVYRIPEDLLDDVIRIRVDELIRSDGA